MEENTRYRWQKQEDRDGGFLIFMLVDNNTTDIMAEIYQYKGIWNGPSGARCFSFERARELAEKHVAESVL